MLMQNLSLNSTVVQKERNLVSDMDGSKVMFNIEQGKYYDLGIIGGGIWDLMSSSITIETMVNQLLNIYDVDKEICLNQVCDFLGELIEENLIEVID
jgi:hypothetical protein